MVLRKRMWVLVFALFGSLGVGSPTRGEAAFRAVWADAFHDGFKSRSQIDSLVARAATGNYNAIIAEVLAYQDTTGGGHGAYWHSAIVPWAAEVNAGFDPLAYLCQQAHGQGIEVHAWLVTYRVSNVWPPSGNSTLAAHPEWITVPLGAMGAGPVAIDSGGLKFFLDPGSPDVQEYIISIVRELVTNYPIDGVNWDYVRYVQKDAGYPSDVNYANSGLDRYRRITGDTGTPSPNNAAWSDFRRRTIDELVRRTRAEIASIPNPRQPLRHTADLICWGAPSTYFESTDAYYLHQNWPMWMERGWLDGGIPMNYKRDHVSHQASWYRGWVDACLGWRYDRHMFCGQATYLNSMANSVAQLSYVYGAGADGSSTYSYVGTADENLDGYWESDWSWYSYVASNFFVAPVPTPEMPWRDPATATEGTLWGQVLAPYTGLPVDNGTVEVDGLDPVYTDGNGYFVVTMIPAAAGGAHYEVLATADGMPLRQHGVTVLPGDIVRQDFHLGELDGDLDNDGDVDLNDYRLMALCMTYSGPDAPLDPGHFCLKDYNADLDEDADIDARDYGLMQEMMANP